MEVADQQSGPNRQSLGPVGLTDQPGCETQNAFAQRGITLDESRLIRDMRRYLILFARTMVLGVLVVACGTAAGVTPGITTADLPTTSAEEFEAHLAALDKPAVVNVWASWCLPCRAEAPILDQASATYGSDIEFIGVDVQDNQTDAKAFLAEFGLDFDHFFDKDREIPNHYAGLGTPITFFFGPGGELISTYNGVVDERTLALNIDELLNLSQ